MTPLFGFIGMFLGWTMSLLSIFLILLVLVQRGRGGGLTGALGGPGGQSAFGSKAGDMFTKITSVAALLWIGLCALATASLGEKPLPADDFADDDVPGLISRDPSDETPLSFPSPTDAENPLDEDQMQALDGALNEAATDAAEEGAAEEEGN
ncbi:preprotein translocase subunit SecG [Roseimaritima ulvae]|uniref:Protein-export membrane protein SecG n=1 Tax=Roseimaritima ulvae TaxID=980254 RepID=A0A5B9QLP6_9BACT|nr:preprotein translocase subunit SecG [Roseimaritima ulvae]QEG38520.1 preprotein translocase subunit SecG [Roseimaritima ulvae]